MEVDGAEGAAAAAALGAGEVPGGVPQPVLDTPLLKVWCKQDHHFGQPKALVNVYIKSPWVAETLEHRVLADLWCGVVMEELNEFSYDASLAGLDYALFRGKTGVQ